MNRIGLKKAIAALREELSQSVLAAANEELQFQVGEITLEFQVEIEQSTETSGKINFWVLEMGVGSSKTKLATHTVCIPLQPVTQNGHPVLTGAGENMMRE